MPLGLVISKVAHVSYSMICGRETTMHNLIKRLWQDEEGQDLVEYALVVALIAFGAVAAMKGLSTEINTAFNVISSDLATSL